MEERRHLIKRVDFHFAPSNIEVFYSPPFSVLEEIRATGRVNHGLPPYPGPMHRVSRSVGWGTGYRCLQIIADGFSNRLPRSSAGHGGYEDRLHRAYAMLDEGSPVQLIHSSNVVAAFFRIE